MCRKLRFVQTAKTAFYEVKEMAVRCPNCGKRGIAIVERIFKRKLRCRLCGQVSGVSGLWWTISLLNTSIIATTAGSAIVIFTLLLPILWLICLSIAIFILSLLAELLIPISPNPKG
jgi:hypothetical protein